MLEPMMPEYSHSILCKGSGVSYMEQVKTIRPRNWFYELLVCLEMLLIIGIWWVLSNSWQYAFIFGGLTYITLAWTLRLILQRHHRNGMQFLRCKKYEEASVAFLNSYNFFATYPWVDNYRFVTMFSSNALPFQQMALNNLGICYLYMGEDEKALEVLKNLAELNNNYPNITKAIEEIQKHIDETAAF